MPVTEILDVRTTTRIETIDITSLVRAAIRKSGIDAGIACVFCPHTTAGLTIQENSDPQVRGDLNAHLSRLVPPPDGGTCRAWCRRPTASSPTPRPTTTPTPTSRAAWSARRCR